jgi:dihydrofolate reductase
MRVVLASVISLDGKIARGDGGPARDWRSPEDGTFLTQLLTHFDVQVIGRTAYEQLRPGLHDRLYVILTSHPEDFAADVVPGKREFTQGSPADIVRRYEKRGYKSMILLTGTAMTTRFLAAGLVDEWYCTIEPQLFGDGMPLLADETLNIHCRLDNIARLNDQGTLLAHYIVEKPKARRK